MLFTSTAFLCFFLPVVLAAFFMVGRKYRNGAATWLVLASLFFYGWWNIRFLALLIGSIGFNFCAGRYIANQVNCVTSSAHGRARLALIASITINLTALAYFKYASFLATNANAILSTAISFGEVVLPLGISFFTFTQIAYLVDTFQRKANETSPVHYMLFVTYFPHLIAGPVLHHSEMMPQFKRESTYRINLESLASGASLFLIGLAKKTVLADSLGSFADPVFDAASKGLPLSLIDSWFGALSYTFQLYFDFSGYSDMAIGTSMLFGIKLPINFSSPYQASSIIEFWKRWHITLSAFLRDYLYIPLGGNKKGSVRRFLNLIITMTLGGLWHGASWNFVVWGALHGTFLILNHAWNAAFRHQDSVQIPSAGRRSLGILLTFLCVVICWVMFRADTLAAARAIYEAMLGMHGVVLVEQVVELLPALRAYVTVAGKMTTLGNGTVMGIVEQAGLIIISCVICFALRNSQKMSERSRLVAVAASIGFVIQAVFFSRIASPFLYFQF
jgi:alginate O-acetyltransferase complex protein AlgI